MNTSLNEQDMAYAVQITTSLITAGQIGFFTLPYLSEEDRGNLIKLLLSIYATVSESREEILRKQKASECN